MDGHPRETPIPKGVGDQQVFWLLCAQREDMESVRKMLAHGCGELNVRFSLVQSDKILSRIRLMFNTEEIRRNRQDPSVIIFDSGIAVETDQDGNPVPGARERSCNGFFALTADLPEVLPRGQVRMLV